jgi:dihydrofolate reductase
MGKVVSSTFVTLDGVMEAPDQWSFDFFSDEAGKYKHAELMASDAMLLGRITYEAFAAAWPTMTDEDGFADRMNSLPKHVASTTLKETTWNATVIEGDLADAVRELKERTSGDILIGGSADVINALTPHGLIDEYRLMIFPLVVGSGKRLFADGLAKTPLTLVDTKNLPNGVVNLTYHPAGRDEA